MPAASMRTRSADTPLTVSALSSAAVGHLQAAAGAMMSAAQRQHQPQPEAAEQSFRGMPQQELLLHVLSQIQQHQQQQQQQQAQPADGERNAASLPNGSHPVGAELSWNTAAAQMR